MSTPELLNKIAKAYKTKSKLFPIPFYILIFLAKIIGRKDLAEKLLYNLQIDCSKSLKVLKWKPIISMDDQIKKMVVYETNIKKINK